MNSKTIYLIDDEESVLKGISYGLKKDYLVKTFRNAESALEQLETERPDLVLIDIGLPGMDGIQALKRIKTLREEVPVIMITAYEDISSVVSAMKAGAHDYIQKPVHVDTLKKSLENTFETYRMRKEISDLQEKYIRENVPFIVGESNAISDVMNLVEKVARTADTPVLIWGESGTGKELIAEAIHYKSPNFSGPFITLNCAAIPADLVESELFGYEKGAFTGAAATGKKGLVEKAANGTLFLDEIGDLTPEAQGKLLRFLEEGEFYRVGGIKKINVKTRVLSATNKNLERLIDNNVFRLDLYYRLAVIKIEIPSLNQRREDIIPIARYFLVEMSRKHDKPVHRFSKDVEYFLENHNWKGNIRELRNLVERGVIIGDGPEMTLFDIGANPQEIVETEKTSTSGTWPSLPPEGIDIENLEAFYIHEALKKANGVDAKAAKLLNMSYYTFRYRKKKLNIK